MMPDSFVNRVYLYIQKLTQEVGLDLQDPLQFYDSMKTNQWSLIQTSM